MLVGLRRERIGITPLHRPPRTQPAIRQQFPRLTRPWFEGGDKGAGKGKDWAERALGWTARIVQHPQGPRSIGRPSCRRPVSGAYSPGAGLGNGSSPGWARIGVSARISSVRVPPARRLSTPPWRGSCCAIWLAPDVYSDSFSIIDSLQRTSAPNLYESIRNA